jgi:hypothetical protein
LEARQSIRSVLHSGAEKLIDGNVHDGVTDLLGEVDRDVVELRALIGDSVSNLTGVSSRAMLEALVGGERDPEVLAEYAQKSMRSTSSPPRRIWPHGPVSAPARMSPPETSNPPEPDRAIAT